jgi:hypothetical protein
MLRASKRLTDAIANLAPSGRHRRVTRIHHVVGLAITAARHQRRWPG